MPSPWDRKSMARKNFGPGWAAREIKASNKRKANAKPKAEPLPLRNPVQFRTPTEPVEHTEGIMCRQGCGKRIVGSLEAVAAHNKEHH